MRPSVERILKELKCRQQGNRQRFGRGIGILVEKSRDVGNHGRRADRRTPGRNSRRKPMRKLLHNLTPSAFAATLALVAAAAASAQGPRQGPVFSSEPRLGIEYVQFGGNPRADFPFVPCSSDTPIPCTIYAGSPAVLAVSWSGQHGRYEIQFAPHTFGEPP